VYIKQQHNCAINAIPLISSESQFLFSVNRALNGRWAQDGLVVHSDPRHDPTKTRRPAGKFHRDVKFNQIVNVGNAVWYMP
jgi:hypothetical protein